MSECQWSGTRVPRGERCAYPTPGAGYPGAMATAHAGRWRTRSLGVIAHHVAWAHAHINARVRAFAERHSVPARRPDLFDERNARLARENPDPRQNETLA